jgi:hypothetical protein
LWNRITSGLLLPRPDAARERRNVPTPTLAIHRQEWRLPLTALDEGHLAVP